MLHRLKEGQQPGGMGGLLLLQLFFVMWLDRAFRAQKRLLANLDSFLSCAFSHLWDCFCLSLFPTSPVFFSHNSEQMRMFQGRESDKMSIQGMIETNKKWLEDFKSDSRVYPLLGSGL